MTTTPRKRVPASAPKPQDHKPKKTAAARKAEAEGFVDIDVSGITLKVPAGENVPMKALLRFQGLNDDLTPLAEGVDGNLLGSAELLGPDQWAKFLAQNPTVKDFQEIGDNLASLVGN